jgi:hypothetical protein
MIENGRDLKRARQALGWSIYQMASALRLTGEREQAGRRVREMEDGTKPVTGPVQVAVEAFEAGFRPEGFSEDSA